MSVYDLGGVEPRGYERWSLRLDRVNGAEGIRPVRQNFFRRAPDPFLIEGRKRGIGLKSGDYDGAGAFETAEALPGPPTACLGNESGAWYTNPDVIIGATVVLASQRIPWPFIITHIMWCGRINPAEPLATDILIKVAGDNDLSGGLNTTGVGIFDQFQTPPLHRLGVANWAQNSYPSFRWLEPFGFLKGIFVNGTATNVEHALVVDFLRLG